MGGGTAYVFTHQYQGGNPNHDSNADANGWSGLINVSGGVVTVPGGASGSGGGSSVDAGVRRTVPVGNGQPGGRMYAVSSPGSAGSQSAGAGWSLADESASDWPQPVVPSDEVGSGDEADEGGFDPAPAVVVPPPGSQVDSEEWQNFIAAVALGQQEAGHDPFGWAWEPIWVG